MNKHICKICGKEFNKGSQLGGHVTSMHINKYKTAFFKKEYKVCPICNKEFKCNNGTFNRHIKFHDPIYRQQFCDIQKKCKQDFFNNAKKSEHFRTIHSEKMKKNNPMFNDESKQKMRISINNRIHNMTPEEYSKFVINYINAPKKGNAVMHSGKYTATKIEQFVINLNIPGLKYNGNKKNSIAIKFNNRIYRKSFVPDFIYNNNKAFIETFGIYWHPKNDEIKYYQEMKANNFKFLILWEDKIELNPEKEKRRILKFLYKIDHC